MRTRTYGVSGPRVVVLHGGPGAPGSIAAVARGLADSFRVIEPMQRRSGGAPLTVKRHIDDLDEVLHSSCPGERPVLVGHSWGAMLALAYAAEHPDRASSLVLIGCGTFDSEARARMLAVRRQRTDEDLRRQMDRLEEAIPNPDERLRAYAMMALRTDSYRLVSSDLEIEECDARGHYETWADMLRLQEEGVYPDAFSAIVTPVLMLHGAHDPHPGEMIAAGLRIRLPQIEYCEWERCGHYPWLEEAVHDEFFSVLRSWLGHDA